MATKSVFPHRSTRLLLLLPICLAGLMFTLPARAGFPGGFLEKPDTAHARPKLTASQIQSFLPERGAFTFPAPYNTEGVRLTNAGDCGGGDCLRAVGYSYWRNTNNHSGSDTMYIVLSLNPSRGGGGPTLFGYNKVTGKVTNLGPLFKSGTALSRATAEGWYFSATLPTKLYLNDGPRMRRYDVLTGNFETVFDASERFGSGYTIWQAHSSDDDKVHSATLRRTSGAYLGCMVYREDKGRFQYFPSAGGFDECQVDRSGRWLMSLENIDGQNGLDMRIIDLNSDANLMPRTGEVLWSGGNVIAAGDVPIRSSGELVAAGVERLVYDQDGAVGHFDAGYGYVIGADNWNSRANAILSWNFGANPLTGKRVFYNNDWSNPPANHISHTNARSDVPMEDQYACGSYATQSDSPWVNEVVCFRLDGSHDVLVAAPVMTDMSASSGGDNYNKAPKGNLDVTGEYFIWTSNTGGSRVDAFLVKVPAKTLMGADWQAPVGSGGNSGNPGSDPGTGPGAGPGTEPGNPGGQPGGGSPAVGAGPVALHTLLTLLTLLALTYIARRRAVLPVAD